MSEPWRRGPRYAWLRPGAASPPNGLRRGEGYGACPDEEKELNIK